MRRVFIVGVGMTRFGKHTDGTSKTLAAEAVRRALGDAGIDPSRVQNAFVANAIGASTTHQEMIAGQVVLRGLGIADIPIFNIENACASASSALHLALMSVAAGMADVSLALGVETMTGAPKPDVARAIGRGVDVDIYPEHDAPAGRSHFMELYAELTRAYMGRSGAGVDVFAAVAAKNYRNGAANPLAQFGADITAGDVLASRTIVDPLTLLMCSPFSDGAAAAVIVSEDMLPKCTGLPVEVLASVIASGSADPSVDGNAVVKASRIAYDTAGIGPGELSMLEVHDAVAPAEVWEYEDLGLVAAGDGPKLVAEGATSLGGRIPVNPSGGLVARGHPIGQPGWARSTKPSCNCEAVRAIVRYPIAASRSPRTPAATSNSTTPRLRSTSCPGVADTQTKCGGAAPMRRRTARDGRRWPAKGTRCGDALAWADRSPGPPLVVVAARSGRRSSIHPAVECHACVIVVDGRGRISPRSS